ncbi:unnamed protein product, partial [Pocillopora meandrina]
VTDALTGLLGRPSYILWRIFQLLVHNTTSCFHQKLVTFEKFIAIEFALCHLNIVTDRKMTIALIEIWIISSICRILERPSLVAISFTVFAAFAYVISYHEARRHQRSIKAQQLPPREGGEIYQENEVIRTTVFVIGAIIFCLLPVCSCLIILAT